MSETPREARQRAERAMADRFQKQAQSAGNSMPRKEAEHRASEVADRHTKKEK
jgi:hypothetical protein